MSKQVFTNKELESFEFIQKKVEAGSPIEDCVCCFFTKDQYFLGNPSPSYGKIGTIAGKVEDGESLNQALVREAQEEATITVDSRDLGEMLVTYEDIKEKLYKSHSFRGVLPNNFEPKMTISDTNLESLPILIHKDALPLMELFGFNPPNNTSLISWALRAKRIEISNLESASDKQIKAFQGFLNSLELSMQMTKQRGQELLPVVDNQFHKKVNNKMLGIEGFFAKIASARNDLRL
jgi:8-oxo-dGTP pyrophosphatase MutT (NUDIX family)